MAQSGEQDKSQRILAGAVALLARDGLQALSYESLAKEADMSRQLLRYYYPDLDTLIAALCERLAIEYREILVSGIVEVKQVNRLSFFLDFFFDLAEGARMPDKLEVYDALIAYSVGSDAVRARMCDQYKTLGQVIIHELAIAHPELDGRACEEISFVFVSMMHAHWSFVASLGYDREHGKLARRAMERLIRSYLVNDTLSPMDVRPWTRDE